MSSIRKILICFLYLLFYFSIAGESYGFLITAPKISLSAVGWDGNDPSKPIRWDIWADLSLVAIDVNNSTPFTETDKQLCSGRTVEYPNGSKGRYCGITLASIPRSAGASYLITSTGTKIHIDIDHLNTIQDVEDAIVAKIGLPWYQSSSLIKSQVSNVDVSDNCLTIGISDNGASNNFRPLIPGVCSSIPDPEVICNVSQDKLILEHGSLSLDEVENHTVSGNISLSCSGDTDADVELSGISSDDSTLALSSDGLIYSDIFLNDEKFGLKAKSFKVTSSTPVNMVIKSVLHKKNGAKAGVYSASAIMVINPM